MNGKTSTDPEYEDLQKTLACVREVTREFDGMTNRLRMAKSQLAVLTEDFGRVGSRSQANRGSTAAPPAYEGAFQEIDQSVARRKALGKGLVGAAAAFAEGLIRWGEDLEKHAQQKQELREEPALLLAPSVPLVTGGNARMLPDDLGDVTNNKNPIAPNKICAHDNSGGKPGVLIYTSDWATYVRYTTSESKFGPLEHAYITYLGASDEFGTILLYAKAGDTVSAEFNGVSYIHRVTISPQEAWYYLNAQDAQTKQEALVFNAISTAAIPRLMGFSAATGASEDVATAAVESTEADVPSAVDAEIPWGKGIRDQGDAWEDFTEAQLPPETRLPPGFKTFDFFNRANGVATSNVTLNTMTLARLAKPGQLFSALVKKIDEAAEFTDYTLKQFPLTSDQIKLRVVRVAIPATTTEKQMEQINAAIRYGRERKVIVIVIETK